MHAQSEPEDQETGQGSHSSWQRFIELKEQSASPWMPQHEQGQDELLNTLMADNAAYWQS